MGLTDVFKSIQESLSFSKTVEIYGIRFELRLLSFEEELKTESMPTDNIDPIVFYGETRLQTLSCAVKSINGEIVPSVIEIKEGEKIQGSLYIKNFISTLPIKIIENLFDAYTDMKEEAEDKLTKEMKYNWFKTPEQREADNKEKKAEKSVERDKNKEENEEKINLVPIPKPPEENE